MDGKVCFHGAPLPGGWMKPYQWVMYICCWDHVVDQRPNTREDAFLLIRRRTIFYRSALGSLEDFSRVLLPCGLGTGQGQGKDPR